MRITASAIVALASLSFATLPARSDEDLGQKLAPIGDSIKKGAEDTGSAIEKAAKDVGSTIQEKTQPATNSVSQAAQDAGPKIEQGAKDTGSYLDSATKGFRDGAQAFFQKVSNFFSGNK